MISILATAHKVAHKVEVNTDFLELNSHENMVESTQKMFTPQLYEQLPILLDQSLTANYSLGHFQISQGTEFRIFAVLKKIVIVCIIVCYYKLISSTALNLKLTLFLIYIEKNE